MVRGHEIDLAHVTDVLAPVLDSYQAVADVPIPVLYRELFARYPEAKFLLLYRNAFDWVGSVRWKLRKGEFRPYVRTVYWAYFDWRPQRIDQITDAQLVWMHGQHMADVTAFFRQVAPRQLGVFDLHAPDTGQRIATFLGVDSNRPLPHLFPSPRVADEAQGTPPLGA